MRKKKLENDYVCNEHFTEDCYKVSFRCKLLGANNTVRVKLIITRIGINVVRLAQLIRVFFFRTRWPIILPIVLFKAMLRFS